MKPKISFVKILISCFTLLNFFELKAQICFEPAINSNFNGGDLICKGDFNGDGNIDLALLNDNTDEIDILIGDGLGSFTAIGGALTGMSSDHIICNDFNNDGKLDIATSNYTNAQVSILFGDGAGGMSTATNYTAGPGNNAVSLTSADFNGDSYADIAVGYYGAVGFNILLNNGNGTFGTYNSYGFGASPIEIGTGDFNNDGNADIVTSNYNFGSIAVSLGNGIGGFSASNVFGTILECKSPKTADFNNDGKIDIAVTNFNNSSISVFLGDGAGNFGSALIYSAELEPISLCTEDFNNDGNIDIAVSNNYSNTMSVLIGDGTGSFNLGTTLIVGNYPGENCAADFDNSGSIDIATANTSGSVSIVLNKLPVITEVFSDTVCGAEPGVLSAIATNGTIYWYSTSTGGAALETGANYTTPIVSTSTIYYVEASSVGCDILPRTPVYLIYNESFDITQDIILNDGDSLVVGTNIYKTSGNYVDTLNAIGGCDSIVRSNITIPGASNQYAFSPNGDEINDVWIINEIDQFPINSVTIFDRWGDEIKTIENYDNDLNFWNGNNKNDVGVMSGTYYYVIKIDTLPSRTGWVQLIK